MFTWSHVSSSVIWLQLVAKAVSASLYQFFFCLFLLILFIWRQRGRGWETGRDRGKRKLSTPGSIPECLQQPEPGRAEARDLDRVSVFHMTGRNAQIWTSSWNIPGCALARGCNEKQRFRLLASAWPRASYCKHLRNEPEHGSSISFCVSPSVTMPFKSIKILNSVCVCERETEKGENLTSGLSIRRQPSS